MDPVSADPKPPLPPSSRGLALRDAWEALRANTAARVALGRTGSAIPTAALLRFDADHAQARDAVHHALDVERLTAALTATLTGHRCVRVHSAAADRATYLLRPDFGRRLDDASRDALRQRKSAADEPPCDVLIVIADGLSAAGIEAHAPALVEALVPRLEGLSIGPIVIAEQARVALGDEVGEAFAARMVVVVIGERPGLTSPDSIGLYLTFEPRVGRHDAERNCISNVRPAGLSPAAAATKLAWLIRASLRLQLSGVALKDESGAIEMAPTGGSIEGSGSGRPGEAR